MTQDPSGSAPETGHIIRGEVIAEGQAAPVTHFQKVASAAHQAEPDLYDPSGDQDDVAAVTSPDGLDAVDDEEHEDEQYISTRPLSAVTIPGRPGVDGDASAGASAGQDTTADHGTTADHDASGGEDADVSDGDQDEVVPVTRADALASGAGSVRTEPAADANRAIMVQAEGYGSLLPDAADIRTQWQRIQFTFVDDPRASVTEAAEIIDQVAARLQAAIQERQRGLHGRWDAAANADTEILRETLRMYRSFLYQLIGSAGTPGS